MASARIGFPATNTPHARLLDDHRFRALLSSEDWGRLPIAIWRRFSKRLVDGATVIYVGEVEEMSFSRAGWWIAQVARLIGGPLPTNAAARVPMVVTVTEDAASGGQVWTRVCTRRNGFPQVIHSIKRFAGSTGLEEYIGYGVSMELKVSVGHDALIFSSAGYAFQLGRLRFRLPDWLVPGNLTVTHADLGCGLFRFTLEIIHPGLGWLLRQSVVFREDIA